MSLATATPQLDVALQHDKVRLIANALGTPPPEVVERVHESGRLVAALCGKVHQALKHKEAGIDFKGLKQLISMGLGTISGDITEINLKDPTRTVVMELEANNFEDKDGNPLWKPDDKGYVAESGEATPVMNYVVPVVLGIGAIGGVVATLNAL